MGIKPITMTNHGMITIPASLRKEYKFRDGDKFLILEDEGTLRIIPILNIKELRKNSFTAKEISEVIAESNRLESNLES